MIPALHHAQQALRAACAAPAATQQTILHHILRNNARSRFGERHGFARIRHYADYARQVPLCCYDDLRTDIAAIAAGHQGILTTQAVHQFEETGGSSGGAKLIPYTPALLAAFRRAVLPWLADLCQHRPQAFAGKCFFVISPATHSTTHTAGGIPLGSGDDLAYLGDAAGAWLAPRILFQPALAKQQSAADWQWQCARLLLATQDLSFISLWSPTLLLAILRTLHSEQESLLATLDAPRRRIASVALAQTPIDTQALWPQLDTISAWDSHTAARPADELRRLFPHAYLQGKGLLSTEAAASIPLHEHPWPLLAIHSHFYEFADAQGACYLAHSLTPGEDYRLIVTTQGGLYRYDSGDCVHIHALHGRVPLMTFIGRDSLSSDLCGEKLTEAFVHRTLARISPELPGSVLLQGISGHPPRYYLLTASAHPAQLAEQLDQALAANPQYALARRTGQLGAPRIRHIPDLHAYAARYHREEQRLSTRKIPLLLPVSHETE